MEIFALFIWPGLALGGLALYGYWVSRKPKSAAEKAAEEAKFLEEARQAWKEHQKLDKRINELAAELRKQEAEIRAEKAVVASQRVSGMVVVRQPSPRQRARLARYAHGS